MAAPTPNYVDPEYRSHGLIPAAVVVTAVGTAVSLARLYTRFWVVRKPGFDDFIIMPAIILNFGTSIAPLLALIKHHFDRHIWDVEPYNIEKVFLLLYVGHTILMVASYLIKLSMMVFYKRILLNSGTVLPKVIDAIIILTLIVMFCLLMANFMICSPPKAYWLSANPLWASTHRFNCGNVFRDVYVPTAVLNAVTDMACAMLPIFFIQPLSLPVRQRIGLYSVFALGWGVCGLAIARAVTTWRCSFGPGTADISWTSYPVWWISIVEINGGLICASLPALKPLFDDAARSYSYGSRTRFNRVLRFFNSGERETGGSGTTAGASDASEYKMPAHGYDLASPKFPTKESWMTIDSSTNA